MNARAFPVLAALAAAVVAGCGLKGPLTLPEKPGEVAVRPAPGPAGTSEAPSSPTTPQPPEARPAEEPLPDPTAGTSGD